MKIRAIAPDDLELICRHREEMFRDAGQDAEALKIMTRHFREWLIPHLGAGSYFGYLMQDGAEPVAGVGLMMIEWPPHPSHPAKDRRGYVLNLYVEPAYRGRGLARDLMRLADEEFRRRGIGYAILHATEKARPMYLKLGWAGTAEMAKWLRDEKTPQASTKA